MHNGKFTFSLYLPWVALLISEILCNECTFNKKREETICAIDSLPVKNEFRDEVISVIKIESISIKNITGELFDAWINHYVLRVYMKNLGITDVSPSTFSYLENLRELDLSGNQLTTIKGRTFSLLLTLDDLNLSKNKINDISNLSWVGTKLYSLNLSNNRVVTIQDGTFSLLPSLEILDLSANQISNITRFSFMANELNNLSLADNHLVMIEGDDFSLLPSLEHLDLSRNQIININRFSFNNNKIKSLNLSHNNLIAFDMLPITPGNRIVLDLSFNPLTNFSLESAVAEKVYLLNLAHTKISELKSGFFDEYATLEYLFLDYNNLTSLPLDIFSNLRLLKGLSLSHNILDAFQWGLFEYLENLTSLDISSNKLSTVGVHLQALGELKELRLDNNKISYLDAKQLNRDSKDLTFLTLDGNMFSCVNLLRIFRDLREGYGKTMRVRFGNTKNHSHIHGIECEE